MDCSKTLPRTVLSLGLLAFGLTLSTTAFSAHSEKHSKHKVAVKKTAPPKPAPVVRGNPATVGRMPGLWLLHNGDKERTDIKMRFNPDGRFVFAGATWKSEGIYRVEDNVLKLQWTAVDGQPVKLGSMHKNINLGDRTFTIDQYTYFKH